MKRNPFIFLFLLAVISVFWAASDTVEAKIYHYTLVEKIENSELIIMAELMGVSGTFKASGGKIGERAYTQFANYNVIEVLKGKYNKATLQIDYKKTNNRYKPFICNPVVYPQKGETVVLFFEKDLIIFAGFQGKINLQKDIAKTYADALREVIKIVPIEDNKIKTEKLTSAVLSDNRELKLMVKKIIVESWGLKDKEYGPILLEVLEDKESDRLLRYKAARRLGDVKGENALNVLSKYLYDDDKIIRQVCAEALGDLGDKRAIKVLEEFIQREKLEPARGTAERSIGRLKKSAE